MAAAVENGEECGEESGALGGIAGNLSERGGDRAGTRFSGRSDDSDIDVRVCFAGDGAEDGLGNWAPADFFGD